MHNRIFFSILIFISHTLYAQNNAVTKRLEEIEKSNANVSSIIELKKMLSSSNLSSAEILAAQTVLIHKYQELQQWDTCLNYCQALVASAHQHNNTLAEATFYKLIGNTYYNIPEKSKAIEYWEKCIVISDLNHHDILLEQCYHNIGSVILESGMNYPEAERNFQKAIQLSIANKTDTTELGNLHYRLLATLYGETNQLKKADDLYQLVIAKARNLNDSLRIAEALMFYAVVLSKEKKFDEAIKTGKEALLISQKFNKLDMEQTALGLLSSTYASSGNYKDGYRYLYNQNQVFVKRFNTDLNSKISEAEAKFKNAETIHEKRMAVLQAKKEKQVYIASIIGLLIAAGFAFFYLNQKRKYRKKIEQLKMQQQVQEEKERLSRDLHDNLGSQLALLSNNVEHLDRTNKKQQQVSDDIDRLKNTSKQLLQTLRETIWILNKEEVSIEDFFDKLIDYTTRYLQSYPSLHLLINEDFDETKTLNANYALQLFRICQEAINNACKYSGSHELIIKGSSKGNELLIGIEDKGSGFDISATTVDNHYGLQNMKQRAASIGAFLTITSEKGKGTLIEARFKI
jgi:signal transduction histidine kinase